MKIKNVIINDGWSYFLGGVIAFCYYAIGIGILAFLHGFESPAVIVLYVASGFMIYYLLAKYARFLSLGFLVASFIPFFVVVLFIIELTIHPPSEE